MVRRVAGVIVGVMLLHGTALAQPGRFQVGGRIQIQTTRESGTVVEVDDANRKVRIRLDRSPATDPGSWYFSGSPDLQPSGAAPQAGAGTGKQGGQGTAPATLQQQDNTPVPNGAAPSTALFKKLIAQRYTASQQADQTRSVDFLIYSEEAPIQHEAIYAGDRPAPYGRGHVVTAYPVHAKLVVRTRYQSPRAPDDIMELEADYLCYRFADSGAWTASQEREVPGSRRIYHQDK